MDEATGARAVEIVGSGWTTGMGAGQNGWR